MRDERDVGRQEAVPNVSGEALDAATRRHSPSRPAHADGTLSKLCRRLCSLIFDERTIGGEFNQSGIAATAFHHVQAQGSGHHSDLKAI